MASIRTILILGALLPLGPAIAQTSAPQTSAPQNSAFVGHWLYDKAQSRAPAGETPPASLITDITRLDSLHARWSITTRDADGKTDTQTFDTPANGEFYPVSSDTTASVQITPAGLQATFKDQSGTTDIATCNLSQNQQVMTCDGAITRADGSNSRYRDVFDRS